MIKDNKYFGTFLGLLSAFIWALAFANVKIALKTFGAMEIASLRFLISGVLGLITLIIIKQKPWNYKDIFQAFFAALIGMAIYNYCLNYGQKFIAPSAASFIVSTQPIFTIIAARLFFKEKIGINAFLGVSICLFGVGTILGYPNPRDFLHGGALFLMICSICSGLYFILLMPLIKRHGALNAAAATVLATGLLLSPWAPNAIQQAQIELMPTMSVVFLAVFPGFIAHITWMMAIKSLGSTNAANFTFLIAPIATIAGVVITHDKLSSAFFIGSAFVILGVFLTINQKVKSWFFEKTKILI